MQNSIKKMTIKEIQNQHPDFRRGFVASVWKANHMNPIELQSCLSISIVDTLDPNKKLFFSLKEAFHHGINEHLKFCENSLNVDLPKTKKEYRYSFVGQMFKWNRDKKEKLDKYVQYIKDFKAFLKDESKLDEYYNEHFQKYENLINEDLNVFDSGLKLGDPVYMFHDLIDYHNLENPQFKIVEYNISQRIPKCSRNGFNQLDLISLNQKNKNENKIDFYYEYTTEAKDKDKVYHSPNIGFKENQNSGVSIEDGEENFWELRQTASNYRLFVDKNELDSYIKEFKQKIIASLDKL